MSVDRLHPDRGAYPAPWSLGISGCLAVGPMLVAYLLIGVALGTLRSSAATTITLIEPLVATVLAVAVVGERLAIVGWVGFAVILAGVAAMSAARHPDKGQRTRIILGMETGHGH